MELVEGQDPYVPDEAACMRTTRGPQRIAVVHRRIDDGESICPCVPELIRFHLGE